MPRLDSWVYWPSNTQTRIVTPDMHITEKDLLVDNLEETEEITEFEFGLEGDPPPALLKKWSLWELRSCRECGVSLDVLKPLGSLTSTWGSGGGSVGMKQGCNFQEVHMFSYISIWSNKTKQTHVLTSHVNENCSDSTAAFLYLWASGEFTWVNVQCTSHVVLNFMFM